MDKVQPKKIQSPFLGEWSTPKIITKDYGKQIVKEAWWYCPSTGQYVTKGIVETIQKSDLKDEPKK